MRRAMKSRPMVLVVVVALVAAGCASGTNPPDASTASPVTSHGGSSVTTSQTARVYDPPRQFASEPIPIGRGQVAVSDGVAYSYSNSSLVAADLATGSKLWSLRLPEASQLITGSTNKDDYAPGIVTDADGQKLIVAAYLRRTASTGTQQDCNCTHVVATDTTGTVRWEADVQTASTTPRIVGAFRDDHGAAVVLDVRGAVVLDAASGKARWTDPRVTPAGVDGDTVIGLQAANSDTHLWTTVALRGDDGEQLWTGPVLTGGTAVTVEPPELTLTSRGRAIVAGRNDHFDKGTVVIDTTNGTPVASVQDFLHCQFDDRDTAVCYDHTGLGELPSVVIGVDTTDGHQLWKLPDEATQRTSLNVTAVFHGAVYGQTTRTPVILDARTGTDVVTDARIAPTQVVPGYGVVTDEGGERETAVYQATG